MDTSADGSDSAVAHQQASSTTAEHTAVAATLANLASGAGPAASPQQTQGQQQQPQASPVGPNPAPIPANYNKVSYARLADGRVVFGPRPRH